MQFMCREWASQTSIFAAMLLTATCVHGLAAQTLVKAELPDAPGWMMQQQAASPPVHLQQGTAALTGIVYDINGGLVPNASIKLVEKTSAQEREVKSDSAGHFVFARLPAGIYTATISAAGLQTFVSQPYTLRAGEQFELPEVALPIPATHADVTVTMTEAQLSQVELKDEEKQRVLGVFPNFYTTFVWNAPPLNAKQKVDLVLHATLDPVELVTTAIVAGVEQYENTYPEYGTDADAYGKRYGAAFADDTIGKLIGRALLPSVLHQDPRYFVMGTGTTKQRVLHAIAFGVICRGDNGRTEFNFSHLGGNAAAGAISTLYRPDTDSAGELAGLNALIGIGGDAVQGLTREFLFRHFTRNVPAYAKGKPQPVASPAPAAAPAPASAPVAVPSK